MNIDKLPEYIAPVAEAIANIHEFDSQLGLARAEHESIALRHSTDVLAKKPDMAAMRALATSAATISVIEEARRGADAHVRAKALPLARFVADAYPELRRLQQRNIAKARKLASARLAEFFDQHTIDAAVSMDRLVRAAEMANQQGPTGAVGYIAKTSKDSEGIHPDVSVDQILEQAQAVAKAWREAEAFERQLG